MTPGERRPERKLTSGTGAHATAEPATRKSSSPAHASEPDPKKKTRLAAGSKPAPAKPATAKPPAAKPAHPAAPKKK
jgi:hypothetical protein